MSEVEQAIAHIRAAIALLRSISPDDLTTEDHIRASTARVLLKEVLPWIERMSARIVKD